MTMEPQNLSFISRTRAFISRSLQSVSPGGKHRVFGLTVSSIFTIIFLSGMQQWKAALPPAGTPAPKLPSAPAGQPVYSKDSSPFSSTIAHIRVQLHLPQRATLLQQSYAPYFHTTHISMRTIDGSQENDTVPERDFWYSSHIYSYPPVANTMKMLMESQKAPDAGLLYFDADDWVSPLQFANMDFKKIWHVSKDDAPEHVCVQSAPADVEGVAYDGTQYVRANKANNAVVKGFTGRFNLDAKEVCYGRSDMYYIPRRFWQDFIDLSKIFYEAKASSRVTIPTILKILERTHQEESEDPFVLEVEDCWMQCCGIQPEMEQILTYRCGRSLDWANQEVISAHFDRLNKDAKSLKQTS